MQRILLPLWLLLSFFACKQKESEVHKAVFTDEDYRPQYHFSPATNWMNDPNGMVYYDGEYHLFYQHYPDSSVWGPMHWGHAVSRDLIHWERLPIALYPDANGDIFSGSAVVDWNNTSGFGKDGQPALVAVFTYHDMAGEKAGRIDYQTQGLAYSLDKGRSWTMYEGNPVMKNPGIADFRDPKVFWYQPGGYWIMSLAVKDRIHFYRSANLKDWDFMSEFGADIGAHGGVWECPDLFTLPVADGSERWVLFVSINPGGPQKGSATQYFIGNFDGKKFTPQDSLVRWIDYGSDNYAGVTFSDVPAEDGRRIFIGWMSNWLYGQEVPTYTWRSSMTLPRTLSLAPDRTGFMLKSVPSSEVYAWANAPASPLANPATTSTATYYLAFEDIADPGMAITISNAEGEFVLVSFDGASFKIDRRKSGPHDFSKEFYAEHAAPLPPNPIRKIEIFMDVSSIEVFVNDGELVMTDILFPSSSFNQIAWDGQAGKAVMVPLQGIWQ
jgi:fructan beta-fructosidase